MSECSVTVQIQGGCVSAIVTVLVLQVWMRCDAYVESRWVCVDNWTLHYSDIHNAYCIWPMDYGL